MATSNIFGTDGRLPEIALKPSDCPPSFPQAASIPRKSVILDTSSVAISQKDTRCKGLGSKRRAQTSPIVTQWTSDGASLPHSAAGFGVRLSRELQLDEKDHIYGQTLILDLSEAHPSRSPKRKAATRAPSKSQGAIMCAIQTDIDTKHVNSKERDSPATRSVADSRPVIQTTPRWGADLEAQQTSSTINGYVRRCLSCRLVSFSTRSVLGFARFAFLLVPRTYSNLRECYQSPHTNWSRFQALITLTTLVITALAALDPIAHFFNSLNSSLKEG